MPRPLERHRAAIARLGADLAILDNAVIDRTLRKSLAALQDVAADEVAVLARLTRAPMPASPVLPPMGERAALNRSVANLDRIRHLATSMDKGQAELTSMRSATNQRTQRLYFLAFLIGSIVCVGAGLLSAQALSRSISRRVAVLARNADRLALGLELEPLPPGEDEIARVDARLRQTARLLLRREDDLRERSRELEAANRELEAFSYSVSHDLRAPLRAIDGFSAAIEHDCRGQLDAAGADALRRVRAAARRMGILIDELLNLSRLTRAELRRTRVDIAASADAILGDLARHGPAPPRGHPHRARAHDRRRRRAGADRPAEPAVERVEVHRARRRTRASRSGATPNGVARVFHVRDNGAGFDMAHVREALRRVPAPAQRPRVRRHGHRPGNRAAHRQPARRADLGRVASSTRARRSTSPSSRSTLRIDHAQDHPAGGRQSGRCRADDSRVPQHRRP